MKKIIILSFFLILEFTSCMNSKKQVAKIEIAKNYYNILTSSNFSKISLLLHDSIVSKEGEYKKVYSQNDYIELLKWDAVFEPEYKILDLNEANGIVKARISKKDKRILFLHEKPIVTNEVITFTEDKINGVAITDYANFDTTVFIRNRSELLSWIDKNHPELNGFLNDQTEKGGLKYLKAIALFNKEK